MGLISGRRWLWAVLVFNAVAIPAVYTVAQQPRFRGGDEKLSGPLAEYGMLADFSLTRMNGQTLTAEEMKGNPWVANFIFTRCPKECPMMSAKFATLQQLLPPEVKLVSFSVDPANDTPERLTEFSKPYAPQPGRWMFLTGDAGTLKAVRRSAHLSDDEDPSLHSLRFVLLDKDLRLRGYYDPNDPDALERIQNDVERLKREG